MKYIENLFKTQKAFVGYLTVGDGGLEKTFEAAKALIEGGVNLLELGVPFSDPIADGAIIQSASQRALQKKIGLLEVLTLAKKLRQITNIPMILFTYFNPLYQYFNQEIFQQIKLSGINGILVVDLPFEESNEYQKQCLSAKLAPIYVISPNSSEARIKKISTLGKGFLYYACRLGTTGVKNDVPSDLKLKIQKIKTVSNLPIVVGFGVSTAKQVESICEVADGFVVGSLFVNLIGEGNEKKHLTESAKALIHGISLLSLK